ncbi:hypothetical protein PTI98_010617 [Pleurotus ostreatus]|nr:hypothetical protein PTI98_010617 [Pleurotus ostreatus]
MDVLWVRWFGRDTTFKAGFPRKRLHRIGFVAIDDDMSFAFLDPNEVIRAVHILPAFHYGTTATLEMSAVADTSEAKNKGKWRFYYVGMFSDRDTAMRFIGGAIGHQSLPVEEKPILPEDSWSDSDDEGSMDVIEEDTEDDIELKEEEADIELDEEEAENDDDNLDEWLSDDSEDGDDSKDSDTPDEESDAASEELEPIQLEYW